ncbi:MAG TPA: metallophosphoesterase, partial [Spirochaetota bacterium]|nr:metallophosphoesterase [Spirochaetota bacterium]
GNTLTGSSSKGYGKLDLGFGINMDGNLFKSDIINVIRMKQTFNFKINGSGSKNLIALNGNGFSASGLDGKGDSFYQEKTYYVNGTLKETRYKLTNDEKFNYFGFLTKGYWDTELNFDKVNESLSLLNRFRLLVGLEYSFGVNHYLNSYDLEKMDFTNYPGFSDGDRRYKKSKYYFSHNIFLGVSLPIELDLRPIKDVQMKFSYKLDFLGHFQKYSVQYSEELIQNGSDNSFYDPVISYTSNNYNFEHTVGFKFRYEFPKVVRLSFGSYYILSHSVSDNKVYIEDNKRVFVSGSEASGPYYSENIKNFDASIYPYNNPANVNYLTQKISPTFEMDFEFIKNFATLTIGWNPVISWDFANPKNEEVIASNILNLANWSISNVIKFQPKDIEKINSKFRPIVKKQDTDEVLVLLHTNDTHGHPIASSDGGGIPARVSIVKEVKSQYKNVLLLDAGDINTGSPESNYFFAEPDILGYNYIGYDAMTIGNHEFDIPLKNLQKQMKNAKFPFLSANVKTKDGKYLAKPYITKKFKNFKVGI